MKNTKFIAWVCRLSCCGVLLGCPEEDSFPEGPCNSDGDTLGGGDEVGTATARAESEWLRGPWRRPLPDELAPPRVDADGWRAVRGGAGLYREATVDELRRYGWAEHSLVFATPLELVERPDTGQTAWVDVPEWDAAMGQWRLARGAEVAFDRVRMSHVQSLALGHFVEHRRGQDARVRRPVFELYGAEGEGPLERSQLLMDDEGGLLLRRETDAGGVRLAAGYRGEALDLPPPPGYFVASISPMAADLARSPVTPFSCENGACEPPDDPLDECQDGVDNDGDGHRDLCDWNCLPHRDHGADKFPEAHSRVEHGKNYALMGGGGLCTELQDTWMVTFADWALASSEFLNAIRPEVDDPVHYRIFSCWVFPDEQAFEMCQHGVVYDEEGNPLEFGEAVCPPGMENYPYQPTEFDPHPGFMLYGEATKRAWLDFELNTLALGPHGEPANGVAFLTNDTRQTCLATFCNPVAGLATSKGTVSTAGRLVVTDANEHDWLTLAHETAHTFRIQHDDYGGGFMYGAAPGELPALGTTVVDTNTSPECVGVDNNATWSTAFQSKHLYPRTSGWRWTGCSSVEHACAPLGKPGWTCNNAWCEPE